MCTAVHKMLFESYLRYCALAIAKLFEVLSLNVILDQKLNLFVIVYCALLTLSKKVIKTYCSVV